MRLKFGYAKEPGDRQLLSSGIFKGHGRAHNVYTYLTANAQMDKPYTTKITGKGKSIDVTIEVGDVLTSRAKIADAWGMDRKILLREVEYLAEQGLVEILHKELALLVRITPIDKMNFQNSEHEADATSPMRQTPHEHEADATSPMRQTPHEHEADATSPMRQTPHEHEADATSPMRQTPHEHEADATSPMRQTPHEHEADATQCKLNYESRKLEAELEEEEIIISSSSSSSSSNEPGAVHPMDIDFSALTNLGLDFGVKQVSVIIGNGVEDSELQTSINHFAHALQKRWTPKGGFRGSALSYFMGCMLRGQKQFRCG